jgi:extracellular elastinolytic metalloproteinase
MQDNWYEAAVSARHPHSIVSVVDWASDASEKHFRPTPKKPEIAEHATYTVFPWGINDPECGEREQVKEYVDSLASPLGWHSIPAINDPKSRDRLRYDAGKINNYTTTWGNNVSRRFWCIRRRGVIDYYYFGYVCVIGVCT